MALGRVPEEWLISGVGMYYAKSGTPSEGRKIERRRYLKTFVSAPIWGENNRARDRYCGRHEANSMPRPHWAGRDGIDQLLGDRVGFNPVLPHYWDIHCQGFAIASPGTNALGISTATGFRSLSSAAIIMIFLGNPGIERVVNWEQILSGCREVYLDA
ncbi:hypothetical protein BD779DRAFT_987615 [Infundibulicybe gibba]|nr:hypothetical protein BD779DRAFT_987615 [Infundibulicybe gibba]